MDAALELGAAPGLLNLALLGRLLFDALFKGAIISSSDEDSSSSSIGGRSSTIEGDRIEGDEEDTENLAARIELDKGLPGTDFKVDNTLGMGTC
jgi:hypothetical protein